MYIFFLFSFEHCITNNCKIELRKVRIKDAFYRDVSS